MQSMSSWLRGDGVSFEEKGAWIMLLVTMGSYGAYAAVVLGRAAHGPLVQVPYASALLWSVGAAVVAQVALRAAVAFASPGDAGKKDQRDKEFHRFGEYIGQSFVI